MVEAALADAEEREIREQSVREWLRLLRDLSYDMEDMHDLFQYQLNASKVETGSSIRLPPPLEDPCFWNDIKERVGKIKQQFDDIARMKEVLGLKEPVFGTRSDEAGGSVTTGSIPSDPVLVGRKEQFEELVELLKAGGADNGNNVEVIVVVGTSGAGKTFLAQHIFQHLEESAHFDVTGWVSVSQDFDSVGITGDVLEAFGGEDCGSRQLHGLQKRIREFIKGKKFFLVMDGVRYLQVDVWDKFFAPFVYKTGARKGSKIVITSCEDGVAATVRATHRIDLGCLTQEDGWSLLQYHAFMNPNAERPHAWQLETIGREIVRKCGCLPLAIKHCGQLLSRNGDDEDSWRHVLEVDDMWEFVQDNTNNTESDGDGGSSIITPSLIPTGSVPSEKKLIGRDVEIHKLVNLMEEEGGYDNGNGNVEVIAIVGMGGCGKTSLAQHIFQKMKAYGQFGVTGWVHVSEDFDLVYLTRDVLGAFTEGQNKYRGCRQLGVLQEQLLESMKGKKLFLIMDDVWNEDVERWTKFFMPLGNGGVGKGSKVLITTRKDRVATTVKASHIIRLRGLSEEDGWSLFRQHAFADLGEEEELCPHEQRLVGIGKDIVKKCGGLPLAIKVLGSCLRNKTDLKHWSNILECNLWDSIQVEGAPGKQILAPLYLSYLRLPSDLKACFKYCSIFHKGEEIHRNDLISLWMAHNLIRISSPSIIGNANGYIDELVSRSFFEYFGSEKDYITIHDLLVDMLQHISGHEFNVMHEKWELLPHARHLRVHRNVSVPAGEISTFKKCTFLRHCNWFQETYETLEVREVNSLRFLSLHKTHVRNLDACLAESRLLCTLILKSCKFTQVPDSLFKLYNLRELNLSSNGIQVIPNSVSNLKNLILLDVSNTNIKEILEAVCALQELSHLDVSSTKVKEIPKAVGGLRSLSVLNLRDLEIVELPEILDWLTNLDVLNLSECRRLERLPRGITELTRLRFLDISWSGISCMPCGISRLTGLQNISKFHIGKIEDGHAGIGELKALLLAAQLERDELEINGLENLTSEEVEEYSGMILSHTKHLRYLWLYWDWDMLRNGSKSSIIKESRVTREVGDDDQLFALEALRPHTNIKRLHITYYKGSNLPIWMSDVSFVNIEYISLSNCGNCTSVSSLGQLPSLETLRISDMVSLRELVVPPVQCLGCSTSSCISFPKLREIHIDSCQSITYVPLHRFPLLVIFIIRKCFYLADIEFMGPSRSEPTSSLHYMELSFCPQLQFSGDTLLLPSLKTLEVSSCKSLENWIKSNRSSSLAHVDFVKLDGAIIS